MRQAWILGACVLTLSALGCGDDESPEILTPEDWAAQLSAPETFTWTDQPLSYTPPPEPWTREREQSGGLFGASHVKRGSVGERIHVAEYTAVGKRDRCSELSALMSELEELSPREFSSRLQRARPYLREPVNESEATNFGKANRRLDLARTEFREGDLYDVRSEISNALRDLHWVKYELEEIVAPAIFTGEGYDAFGTIEVFEPTPGTTGGEPSLSLDYTLISRDRGITYQGREVYVAHNNRLFVASFQGLAENLPLFDALVRSIQFPEGSCDH